MNMNIANVRNHNETGGGTKAMPASTRMVKSPPSATRSKGGMRFNAKL